ncbi:prolyl endopeptidase [Fulvitalea axinellae]|uniref:prolyl oligopeptidase n=1 Tax=Fulvitalea axinellae TaxID=1182444 RepID=A0AAU9DC00_9BACT|nr:prolyl endopeptidase [Fulvitalea axinellae]
MKKSVLLLACATGFAFASCGGGDGRNVKEAAVKSNFKPIAVNYPETKTVDQTDDYFGTKVADPYRWLEADTAKDTEAWVKAQNVVTDGYLEQIPFRSNIKDRLEKIWNYPKFGSPFKAGDKWYFFKNNGLQNQSVLYQQASLDGEPTEFLDPNKLSEDGTVALGSVAFSRDGKYLAYSVSRSGSDWKEIFVMDVATKKLLADHIKWSKFSGIAWQGNGFYYSRYDAPSEGSAYSGKNKFHKVYFHKVGESQDADKLIYEDKEHELRNFYAYTTEEEDVLVLSASEGTSGNMLMVKPTGSASFITLVDNFDNDHSVVESVDGGVLVKTNLDAPNNRLVKVDFKKPTTENWKDLIPNKDKLLQSVSLVGGKMMVKYMEDATSKVYRYELDGKELGEVALPGIGTASGFGGKKTDKEVFYSFTSFTFPSNIYKYDIESNKSELFRASEIDFKAEDYETKQVFYTSKDDTKVPMFITHKKGLKLDGTNPTYLYAYGGFDISLTPYFSTTMLVWLENGGVYAQPNIRGGGEYGQAWHEGGMKLNKQNVFDDFIAAGEYLIKENYTSKERLAIAGGSNGGLLVGACMTQRPDLYKVAFPAVGVLDMLRYHKFTIGWAWAVEYGSSDEKEHFDNLIKYSPLHNVKDAEYPATMILTADHDDRVVPAHSFKFAATLQKHQQGQNPTLIRIESKAGHGAGKPTDKIIEEKADVFAFAWYNMGFEPELAKQVQ